MTFQDTTRSAGPSLAEIAYQTIKRDIIHCALQPGAQVTEVQLAARYGAGRAAVRTALSRLYQERLVQVVPRQHYVIVPITIKRVRDLFGVRLLLEPPAARLAAGHADPDQIARLDALCRAARYDLGDQDSAGSFLQANTEFHVTVASASGNERLAETLAGLLDEMERFFHLGLMRRDRNDEMYHEHHDLVEALLAGDGERAERIAVDQVRSAQKMVIDALLESPSLQSVVLTLV